MRKKKTKIIILLLILSVIAIKSISFYLSWDYGSALILKNILSLGYYALMSFLMVYSSSRKKSTWHFLTLFCAEWLVIFVGVFTANTTYFFLKIPIILTASFIMSSHQLAFPLIESFEFMGNYRAFLLILVYVGFIIINVLSRRSKDVKNKVE